MAEERVQRRLAAILAADVVGYSRLMQLDEAGTLAALKTRRSEVLQPVVLKHHGRIVKLMGDGVLVEFGSAVNAVECAVELQATMDFANRDVPEDRRIVLRVGINLGDVMVEGTDLYGDGVNIAARLEALADPRCVFVSQTVFSHVKGKTKLDFEDLGEQSLKNISEPVHIYRVARARGAEPEGRHLPLPDKPSIAVLPFTNMSGEPEQQYFSDGITEDIITELSRFRSLFVIARNSSFQFRDKAVDVRRVAKELGVRYVAEGSVRKLDTRLRITVQLIEATTGHHLWSERYDRNLADVFAVQDEVVQAIVARLAGQLTTVEAEKARRKRTEHLGAYECYLRGFDQWRSAGPDSNIKTILWCEKALELDSDYAEPLACMAFSAAIQAFYSDAADRFEPALAMANKAVALDPNNSWSHCALGFVKSCNGSLAASAGHFKTAMQLNPNDPDQLMWYSLYHIYSGDFTAAHEVIAMADRLNPLPPTWYQTPRAMVEYCMRHYAAAAQLIEGLGSDKHFFMRCYLAACYERLGKMQEAKREIARALEAMPNLTVRKLAIMEPYVRPDDMNNLLEPLRKLGLPD
jgi:adenylate cyclase